VPSSKKIDGHYRDELAMDSIDIMSEKSVKIGKEEMRFM